MVKYSLEYQFRKCQKACQNNMFPRKQLTSFESGKFWIEIYYYFVFEKDQIPHYRLLIIDRDTSSRSYFVKDALVNDFYSSLEQVFDKIKTFLLLI